MKLKHLALASLSLALVGCGANDSSKKTSSKEKTLVMEITDFKGQFHPDAVSLAGDGALRTAVGLHGKQTPSLVSLTKEGEYKFTEQVVEKVDSVVNPDGSKTFTFQLKKDLKWSDGKPLTAKDYLFQSLFYSSGAYHEAVPGLSVGESDLSFAYKNGVPLSKVPEVRKELAGIKAKDEGESQAKTKEIIKKYADLNADGNAFDSGMKLIDEYTFSLTLAKTSVPYFFEKSLFQHYPLPMHVLAPNAKVEQSEKGVHVTGVKLSDVAANFLKEDGYSRQPKVTAGPYVYEKSSKQEFVFKVNKNYAGDLNGQKPKFDTLVLKFLGSENKHQRLIAKEVDVVTKLMQKEEIDAVLSHEHLKTSEYFRSGMGYLLLGNGEAGKDGVTADRRIRRAIAHLVDRQQLATQLAGAGRFKIVDSFYTVDHWLYKENKEALEKAVRPYVFSVDEAIKLLDETDFKFQKDGKTPWAKGSGIRHNSKGEELKVKHFATVNNPVSDFIKLNVEKAAQEAGMKFEVEMGDFQTLIDKLVKWKTIDVKDRALSFNLGTDVDPTIDLYKQYFQKENVGLGGNYTKIYDPKLEEISKKLRSIDSSNREEYSKLWVELQKEFNELTPLVPLYANKYFDAYDSTKIKSLNTSSYRSPVDAVAELEPAD